MKNTQIKKTLSTKETNNNGLVILPNKKIIDDYTHSLFINDKLISNKMRDILGNMDVEVYAENNHLIYPSVIKKIPDNLEIFCLGMPFYKYSDVWIISKTKGVFAITISFSDYTFQDSVFNARKFINLFSKKIKKIKGVEVGSLEYLDDFDILFNYDIKVTLPYKIDTTINVFLETFKKKFIPIYESVMKQLLSDAKKEIEN